MEPRTHTKRSKRHAGNFLWSLASRMTRGRVRTYVAFHDILTCSNFRAASSQWRARNRVSLLTRVAQATLVAVKKLLKTVDNFTVKWYPAAIT